MVIGPCCAIFARVTCDRSLAKDTVLWTINYSTGLVSDTAFEFVLSHKRHVTDLHVTYYRSVLGFTLASSFNYAFLYFNN